MPERAEERTFEQVGPPAAPAAGAPPRRWVVPLVLAVSLLPRLPNLGAPVIERHDFRQTQTAITVQAFLDRGVDLLRYETPVFGPPWRVPYELPIFQVTAWAIAKAGVPLDPAARLAGLLWFYASALVFYALVRRFTARTAAVWALVLYVASPIALVWSRASHIDYASVALSLGYLLAAVSWAERPRPAAVLAAAALGALACATKATTVPSVAPALAMVVLGALRRAWRVGASRRAAAVGSAAVMALVPLLAGIAWTRWTDVVKDASPATQWTTTARLAAWNFGTMAQRLEWARWETIFFRMRWVLPGLFSLAVAFALAALWRRRGRERAVVAVALAGALLPIAIFFNLYWVHEYYLVAVTPCLATLAGVGIAELAALPLPRRRLVLGVLLVAAIVLTNRHFRYAKTSFEDTRRRPVVALAALVARVTPPEGWVVVEGDDWNPRIPYLAHRRAFMIRPPQAPATLVADRPEVATLVCFECPPDVLALWPDREWVGREAGAEVFRAKRAGAESR